MSELALNAKVKTNLGAEGIVERIERGKDGQILYYIRWKTGALGTYSEEELKRYKIKRVTYR